MSQTNHHDGEMIEEERWEEPQARETEQCRRRAKGQRGGDEQRQRQDHEVHDDVERIEAGRATLVKNPPAPSARRPVPRRDAVWRASVRDRSRR